MTESESGLTFQQAHPMVTLENIRAIMPEQFMYQYPTYSATETYRKGAKVSNGDKVWESTADDNEGNTPEDGSEYWSEYDFTSVWIERLTRSAIAKTVQTFLQMKSLLRESKNLLERRSLFDGAGLLPTPLSDVSFCFLIIFMAAITTTAIKTVIHKSSKMTTSQRTENEYCRKA
jgi:hypothetical protein